MEQIYAIREQVGRSMAVFLWLHVPVIAIVAAMISAPWLMSAVGAAILAAASTVIWRAAPQAAAGRHAMGVALMGMVALLVLTFEGHPWQIDMHMYFFAALAILTAFCDWRTLVTAAAAVAVHHLLLNFVYPAAVFPGGASFLRVVLHAVIVVLQTGVLSWVAWRLVTSFSSSSEALKEARAARAQAEQAASERDRLSQQNQEVHHEEMERLAGSLQAEVGKVVQVLSGSADGARVAVERLDSMVDDVRTKAGAASSSAAEVASNVDTVAAATDQLSVSVTEVNRFIDESITMAHEAVAEVEKTNATVESLSAAANRIGDVVNLIQTIASQTNLLALNATIEAARAGEAGKGFAVVANEVKGLANQTAKATDDIGAQISEIQTVSDGAVAAIRGIGGIISRIETAIGTIAQSASAQGTAIGDIAASAQRAAGVTDTVSTTIAGLSEVARQLEGFSEQRVQEASELATQAVGLSQQVEDFAARVRAG